MSSRPLVVSFVLIESVVADDWQRQATLASLAAQTCHDWELVRVAGAVPAGADDGASPEKSPLQMLRDGLARATGDLVALLRPGDELHVDCVAEFLAAAGGCAQGVLVYGNHRDTLEESGTSVKPVWSPERLRHHNYIGRPWAATSELVREASQIAVPGPAWEHDLVLAITERADAVRLIPEVLIAGPRPERPAATATADVVSRHASRVGLRAHVAATTQPGIVRLERELPAETTVSVVIPTGWGIAKVLDADGVVSASEPLVINAVRTLLAHTDHAALDVVVVYDEPVPEGAIEALREIAGERLRLVRYTQPFNFSEKCNLGALATESDVIILINDDVLPITCGWLEALVAPLAESDLGMTGAKLRFPDGKIQSGGHWYGRTPKTPEPDEAFRLFPADHPGPDDALSVSREVSGVTGACLAIRRDVFQQVGGLAEALSHNYNDVDLCLKVRRAGWRIVWVAECEMIHLESQSRTPAVHAWEHDILRHRWGGFTRDPYLPGDLGYIIAFA